MTDPDISRFEVYYRVIVTYDCTAEVQARTKEEAELQFLENCMDYFDQEAADMSDIDLLEVIEVVEG